MYHCVCVCVSTIFMRVCVHVHTGVFSNQVVNMTVCVCVFAETWRPGTVWWGSIFW